MWAQSGLRGHSTRCSGLHEQANSWQTAEEIMPNQLCTLASQVATHSGMHTDQIRTSRMHVLMWSGQRAEVATRLYVTRR